jgi:RHS repeat-associated protein
MLQAIGNRSARSSAYGVYGYSPLDGAMPGVKFDGQYQEAFTGFYLLGNGYRTYDPVVMRFHSPDRLSPFGRGGLNAYAFCNADPVNNSDPSGKVSISAFTTATRVQKYFSKLSAFKASNELVLVNKYRGGGRLAREFGDIAGFVKARLTLEVTVVRARKDIDVMSFGDGLMHKYVITERGEFIIGSTHPRHEISHAAFAKYAEDNLNAGGGVISAGHLVRRKSGTVVVDNHSGHYLPGFDRARLAANKLRGVGVPSIAKERPF